MYSNFITNSWYQKVIFLLVYSCFLWSLTATEKITFQSSSSQSQLIELFTSQGCSSCPPTERWLNRFVTKKDLWTKFVPLAFHVDYWDYIGWKDVYAQKQFTKRQRFYRKNRNLKSVYTPALLINGKEWRGGKFPHTTKQTGILSGSLRNNQVEVFYSGLENNLELHVALLGFEVKTQVLSGENSNKLLEQEFLVLNHQKLFTTNQANNKWNFELPKTSRPEVKKLALALWVNNKKDLLVLQATGFWL